MGLSYSAYVILILLFVMNEKKIDGSDGNLNLRSSHSVYSVICIVLS